MEQFQNRPPEYLGYPCILVLWLGEPARNRECIREYEYDYLPCDWVEWTPRGTPIEFEDRATTDNKIITALLDYIKLLREQ